MQYHTIKVKKCKKILLINECHYEYERRPKGYSLLQLKELENSLDTHFKITLKNNLKHLDSTSQIIITQETFFYSMSGKAGMRFTPAGNFEIKKNLQKEFDFYYGGQYYNTFGHYSKKGKQPYSLRITEKGNMMIIDSNNKIMWETKTEGKGVGPYSIYLTEDGNFVLIDSRNYAVWDSEKKYSKYESIILQDTKVFSDNGQYYLFLFNNTSFSSFNIKTDVDIDRIFDLEDSDDRGVPPYIGVVENGYFKIYDSNNRLLYQSSPFINYSKPGIIKVSDSGKIIVVDSNGRVIWKFSS